MFKKNTDRVIVLGEIKYKDNLSLIEVFSEQSGKTVYGFRPGSSKKHHSLRVKLRPSHLLEVEYVHSPRFHSRITAASYRRIYRSIPYDLRKTAVASFMVEILRSVVRGNDAALFYWADRQFELLDAEPYHPDYHLKFLKEITRKLGILPEEPQNGIIFVTDEKEAILKNKEVVRRFLDTGKTENKEERRMLTDWWLHYLAYHVEDFRFPRSHKIFADILG